MFDRPQSASYLSPFEDDGLLSTCRIAGRPLPLITLSTTAGSSAAQTLAMALLADARMCRLGLASIERSLPTTSSLAQFEIDSVSFVAKNWRTSALEASRSSLLSNVMTAIYRHTSCASSGGKISCVVMLWTKSKMLFKTKMLIVFFPAPSMTCFSTSNTHVSSITLTVYSLHDIVQLQRNSIAKLMVRMSLGSSTHLSARRLLTDARIALYPLMKSATSPTPPAPPASSIA